MFRRPTADAGMEGVENLAPVRICAVEAARSPLRWGGSAGPARIFYAYDSSPADTCIGGEPYAVIAESSARPLPRRSDRPRGLHGYAYADGSRAWRDGWPSGWKARFAHTFCLDFFGVLTSRVSEPYASWYGVRDYCSRRCTAQLRGVEGANQVPDAFFRVIWALMGTG